MTMMRTLFVTCALALAACNQPAGSGAPAGDAPQAADAGPVSCDQPAVQVAIGAQANGEITATTQPYPANADYFCVNVGPGVQRLTLELSGMTVDLDLYVGHGSIDSVQGINLEQGETYEWKSNAFGTETERVVIDQPQPGVYYAEIISYNSEQSAYQFAAR
jgi:hypothetical protein